MDEEYSGGVFGPPPQEEINNNSFWKAFKVNFILIVIAIVISIISLALNATIGRYIYAIPLLSFVIGFAWAGFIIAGLPVLSLINFINAGNQFSKGNKTLGKGFITCGVICILVYGGCWAVLLPILSGI